MKNTKNKREQYRIVQKYDQILSIQEVEMKLSLLLSYLYCYQKYILFNALALV